MPNPQPQRGTPEPRTAQVVAGQRARRRTTAAPPNGASRSGTGTSADLVELRRTAFGAAYRMLGTVTDAEDVAQEALLRVTAGMPADVRNPQAWVTTVATRIALDVLRSARVRRERYVGDWVQEPLTGDLVGDLVAAGSPGRDAAAHAELADDLTTAFLVLLERLTPAERAAFLLHDVLGYPHRESAHVIGTTEVAARQLASRARRRVEAGRAGVPERRPADASRAAELVERFIAATNEGDVETLLSILAEDVSVTGDGGGNTPAGISISRPVTGRESVVRLLSGFWRRGAPAYLEPAVIGGAPGILVRATQDVGGGLIGTYSIQVTDGRIATVHGVANPDKLQHLAPLADLSAVAAEIRRVGRERRSRRR